MCAKEYLQQAYIIDKKIKLDLQKLEAAKASLQCRAVNYDRVGTSTNKNGIDEAIARVMDFENHINSEIKSLTELPCPIRLFRKFLQGGILCIRNGNKLPRK